MHPIQKFLPIKNFNNAGSSFHASIVHRQGTMSFDHIFKEVMRVLFGACNASPEDVGKLPLHVNMVVRCKDGPPPESNVPLLGRRFSRENVLECKRELDTKALLSCYIRV